MLKFILPSDTKKAHRSSSIKQTKTGRRCKCHSANASSNNLICNPVQLRHRNETRRSRCSFNDKRFNRIRHSKTTRMHVCRIFAYLVARDPVRLVSPQRHSSASCKFVARCQTSFALRTQSWTVRATPTVSLYRRWSAPLLMTQGGSRNPKGRQTRPHQRLRHPQFAPTHSGQVQAMQVSG